MTTLDELVCPRCGRHRPEEHADEYYGPCVSCRRELRHTVRGQPRDIEVPEYEPKMNVTPNAVASRDD